MSKEVAKVEKVEFAVLAKAEAAIDAIRANLDGETLSPMDLDRVRIPAGGGVTWEVPGLEGEETTQKLVGVIVGVQNCRAYWAEEFSGSSNPPDCVSEDAVIGVGNPGGSCHGCPMAQFGSSTKGAGKGQACKQMKRLFLLRPESMLPLVVNLPPTSIKAATRYQLRLGGQGYTYQSVVTRITLEKTKSSEGITYSTAIFAMVGKLDPDQAAIMDSYGKKLSPMFRRPIVADDFKGTE